MADSPPRHDASEHDASEHDASEHDASERDSARDLASRIAALSIADAHRLGRRLARMRRGHGDKQGRRGGTQDRAAARGTVSPGSAAGNVSAAGRGSGAGGAAESWAKLEQAVARAEDKVHAREVARPQIRFPPALPVSARADDLADAIRDHQVVVVAGETGSGKSTQLPKICLQLGRGVRGLIGHTQPRRIAARTLADRIAEETESIVGQAIGYRIRFGDHTSPRTLVKLMTDGILLAEIVHDPDLLAYDTIIIDEAHERSLNIDFLLGYLARLLPRRPDLKLIITSATIDPEKFSRHFSGAPIVEVSGRTYPVEIRYRPYGPEQWDEVDGDPDDNPDGYDEPSGDTASYPSRTKSAHTDAPDQQTAIIDAVDELTREGDGDILVFLSGEREITDTADALRAHLARAGGLRAATQVLPLYGRLSMADQHKVFAPSGKRRIVLATNVAETSLTVPGIRYVIDPGTARISRYSLRSKVQRLPIERISQASAGQRAGRCGRVADGICIRLYSRADFEARAEYTDPEIARTSLASVILQMAALGLGDIESFPFVDPPDRKQITDGITVLRELGALQPGEALRLTGTGRKLAALPIDPRLARIVVEADRRRCLAEILVIVSGLAIRDVREYPVDDRDRAVAAHARFVDPTSDFLGLVNLWNYVREEAKARSGNGFRKMCKAEYLHYLRIREWQDLHAQLRSAAGGLKLSIDSSARTGGRDRPRAGAEHQGRNRQAGKGSAAVGVDRAAVHTALAAGLLSHIGARIERDTGPSRRPGRQRRGPREYQGTRGTTFAIWPGSAVARSGAPFVLAAELVDTSRLWARTVAAVDPAWVEQVGGDLLRRHYSDPYWSAKREAAMVSEKVLLLGVTVVAARPVAYDRVDRDHARELFIRHGLVEGQLRTSLPFRTANQRTLDDVAESERRARRRDIAVDDDALFALYDERLPADVTSVKRLEAWWRKASGEERGRLTFGEDELIAAGSQLASRELYPDRLTADGLEVDLDYVFEPGAADDGVSATVPLAALASLDPDSLPAQVPGLRRELAMALIRSLPKTMRRSLVPTPDFADAALQRIGEAAGSFPDQLAVELSQLAGIRLTAGDFDYSKVPDHLRMTFTVVDRGGSTVASGKDLQALQRSLRTDTRRAVAQVSPELERTGLTDFPSGGLRRKTTGTTDGAAGHTVTGYPALVDEGEKAGIRVFTDEADQARAMRFGTRRLLAISLTPRTRKIAARLQQPAPTGPRAPAGPGGPPGGHPRGPDRPGGGLDRQTLLRLSTAPHGSTDALLADAVDAAIDALLDWAGGPAWDPQRFHRLGQRIGAQLDRAVMDILAATAEVLAAEADAVDKIEATARVAPPATYDAMCAERAGWVRPGFITDAGASHLPDIARYLQALGIRAERLVEHPERDAERAAEITELQREVDARLAQLRAERRGDEDVTALRRLLAEYRIVLFAQPMRTAVPASAKRIRAAIAALPD